jgi:hypothetical protein
MKHLLFFCNTMGAGALVLVLGCLVPSGLAEAPKFLWAQRLGGTNQEYGTRIAVDSAGSSYAIGKFSGPTMPIGGLILTNGGIFIAKFDITGNVTWARQIWTSFAWAGVRDRRLGAGDRC